MLATGGLEDAGAAGALEVLAVGCTVAANGTGVFGSVGKGDCAYGGG